MIMITIGCFYITNLVIEMTNYVTFESNKLTLCGEYVESGSNAFDFNLVDNGLNNKSLSDYSGEMKIISVVPSLDTPVCDMQTKKISELYGNHVKFITVSVDLPFAQARYAKDSDIKNCEFLSDYKDWNFGKSYGFLIEELKLLSRGVCVVDEHNKVLYAEYVSEITNHINYEAISEYLGLNLSKVG